MGGSGTMPVAMNYVSDDKVAVMVVIRPDASIFSRMSVPL
jgi:hypothetical protein